MISVRGRTKSIVDAANRGAALFATPPQEIGWEQILYLTNVVRIYCGVDSETVLLLHISQEKYTSKRSSSQVPDYSIRSLSDNFCSVLALCVR